MGGGDRDQLEQLEDQPGTGQVVKIRDQHRALKAVRFGQFGGVLGGQIGVIAGAVNQNRLARYAVIGKVLGHHLGFAPALFAQPTADNDFGEQAAPVKLHGFFLPRSQVG